MTKDERLDKINNIILDLNANKSVDFAKWVALYLAFVENELYNLSESEALIYINNIFSNFTIYKINYDHASVLWSSNEVVGGTSAIITLVDGKVNKSFFTWGNIRYCRDLIPPELLP